VKKASEACSERSMTSLQAVAEKEYSSRSGWRAAPSPLPGTTASAREAETSCRGSGLSASPSRGALALATAEGRRAPAAGGLSAKVAALEEGVSGWR
jgi:hypothetical protein